MRVTEKGQVTIPKTIRDRAGIGPGTEIDFAVQDGRVVLFKRTANEGESERRAREFRAYLERVRGTADAGLGTGEIMEMTRGPFDDVDPR